MAEEEFNNKIENIGLVVSPPIEIEGNTARIRSSNLDPQELRFSVLFWDRLVWPSSNLIYFASGPDEQFLEDRGVLTRPRYNSYGDAAQSIAQTQIKAFNDLDNEEPGLWSLAQGENSLFIRENVLNDNSGILLELYRAIPIPDKEVPLEDIINFKYHREDEIKNLRKKINEFFTSINESSDFNSELNRKINELDSACSDIIRVSSEWQQPVRLTNFKISFDIRPAVPLLSAIAAYKVGAAEGLPTSAAVLYGIGGALAATAPALKLSGDFGWRGLKRRLGPYRYVYDVHNELF